MGAFILIQTLFSTNVNRESRLKYVRTERADSFPESEVRLIAESLFYQDWMQIRESILQFMPTISTDTPYK